LVQYERSSGWLYISNLEILYHLLHVFVDLVSSGKNNSSPNMPTMSVYRSIFDR
jgi:hypothetical protein